MGGMGLLTLTKGLPGLIPTVGLGSSVGLQATQSSPTAPQASLQPSFGATPSSALPDQPPVLQPMLSQLRDPFPESLPSSPEGTGTRTPQSLSSKSGMVPTTLVSSPLLMACSSPASAQVSFSRAPLPNHGQLEMAPLALPS